MARNTEGTVTEFSEAMETTLQTPQNARKPHWRTRNIPYLIKRLYEEVEELEDILIALKEVERLDLPYLEVLSRIQEKANPKLLM